MSRVIKTNVEKVAQTLRCLLCLEFCLFQLRVSCLEVLDSASAYKQKEKETGKQEDDIVKRKKFPSFPSTFSCPEGAVKCLINGGRLGVVDGFSR